MNVSSMVDRKVNHSLHQRVKNLVERDYQFIAGERVQNMFADDLVKLVDDCYKEPWKLDVGQVVWYGVDAEEKPSYGKNSKNTPLTPVILSLITAEDLKKAENGFSHREIRKEKAVRLFKEAKEQDALLTHSDVAFLLHVSTGTVSKDIREYMEETNEIVPTRGIVHDIGRAMTHKKIIVRLFKQGYQTPEIARMTNHTLEACDRYIKAYKRVKKLSEHMNIDQIAPTLGMGRSLVQEYVDLIKEVTN